MTNPADLAPGGNAAKAGLISGQLPSGGPTPLPASFLAHVARLPQTEVVSLLEVQAYRYSQLNVGGFAGALVVYVVPSPGGRPTAAACYAAQGFLAEMQVCERIIATLTLVEHPHTYDLTPEPGYARQLSDVIAGLEQRRVSLRRAIHEGDAPAAAEGPAQGLANAFTQTAASLSVLEPPLVASQDQALLDRSVARAGDGYSALVAALSSESPSDYDAARAQIDEAEASVDSALEGLTLLGYQAGAPAS